MELKDGAICLPDSTMADCVPTMERTLANTMAGARPTGAVSSGYGKMRGPPAERLLEQPRSTGTGLTVCSRLGSNPPSVCGCRIPERDFVLG